MSELKSPSASLEPQASGLLPIIGPRHLKAILILCGLAATGIFAAWGILIATRSPRANSSNQGRISSRTPSTRPASPQNPTLANVPKNQRVPLPGFENIEPAFSPTLTSDLKTIVFAGAHPTGGYDLFISSRQDVNQPFESPKHIVTCASLETDAYPTLSSDGLNLIFVRSDKHPRAYYASRNNLTESFGTPKPVDLGEFKASETNFHLPQFATDLDLIFMVRTNSRPGWEIRHAKRKHHESVFETPIRIPFADPSPPYRLSNNLMRAYFGWQKGIWMANRATLDEAFGSAHTEIHAKIAGEIEGPIFVSPLEDVFIFCSPDSGKKVGESRKLWVLQP